METFREALLSWYDRSRRDLPWRHTHDPYAILVSELMLQQTQVKTVIPYYLRFLERFPTVRDLARAEEGTVLKLWQGLGYYRRAKHLMAAARQVVEVHGGVFPNHPEDIDNLKGVGAYTGAAVGSIAFGLKRACVDGNVIRVISRLTAFDEDVALSASRKTIGEVAQTLLSHLRPGDFNQAMMELGATVCTPRAPCCLTCPVNASCQTWLRGEQPERRPFKRKRAAPSKVDYESLFLFSGDRFLLCQRPNEGLMGSMWELPSQVIGQDKPWQKLFLQPLKESGRLEPIAHKFTHLHATYRVSAFHCIGEPSWVKAPTAYSHTRWFSLADLDQIPLTKVLQKLLPTLAHYLKGDTPCPANPSLLPGVQPMS